MVLIIKAIDIQIVGGLQGQLPISLQNCILPNHKLLNAFIIPININGLDVDSILEIKESIFLHWFSEDVNKICISIAIYKLNESILH